MEKQRIDELVAKFNAGTYTPAEQREIEQLLEEGSIDLNQLHALSLLEDQVVKLNEPTPSLQLDQKFYSMVGDEKRSISKVSAWKNFFTWPALFPKLAMASVFLLIGVSVGYFVRPEATGSEQITVLSNQVNDLQEMMMLSLLEKESVTERLKAVSLTGQMDQASQKVTGALLETLNNDENVNVRLAALDALHPYIKDSKVREALIKSIAVQNSPLVQIALAEVMAESQVKSSVKELQKILQDEKTPRDVKKKMQESIQVLI
jgi:uncharacterized protein (UPF0147 family)